MPPAYWHFIIKIFLLLLGSAVVVLLLLLLNNYFTGTVYRVGLLA